MATADRAKQGRFAALGKCVNRDAGAGEGRVTLDAPLVESIRRSELGLNVEHRTLNFEHRMKKTRNPDPCPPAPRLSPDITSWYADPCAGLNPEFVCFAETIE